MIAGDHLHGQPFVAGRVVNVAKRLEEAAGTNEILMSAATHDLVRAAVVVEPVSDRLVKGGETVEALRLVTVFEHAPGRARRFDSPLVGREGQLSSIRARVRERARESRLPPHDRPRPRRHRQVAARAGVRRRGRRRRDGAARPLPALRRGHHLLAAHRGRPGTARQAARPARSGRSLRSPSSSRASSRPA